MALRAVLDIVVIRRACRASCRTGRWEFALSTGVDVSVLVHESVDGIVDQGSSVDVERTLWGGVEDVVLRVKMLLDKRSARSL
jgi:hypothetical protein